MSSLLLVVLLLLLCGAVESVVIDESANESSESDLFDGQNQSFTNRQNDAIVKQTIRASASNSCDIFTNPVAVLRGEICGAHYKVLGINRKLSPIDKSTVKKAFRKLSLATHPDKNTAKDSQSAFTAVRSAYDTLSDSDKQRDYNYELDFLESEIRSRRSQLKKRLLYHIKSMSKIALEGFSSVIAYIHEVGEKISQLVTWKVNILDYDIDVGKSIAALIMYLKAKPILLAYLSTVVIIRLREELRKKGYEFSFHGRNVF